MYICILAHIKYKFGNTYFVRRICTFLSAPFRQQRIWLFNAKSFSPKLGDWKELPKPSSSSVHNTVAGRRTKTQWDTRSFELLGVSTTSSAGCRCCLPTWRWTRLDSGSLDDHCDRQCKLHFCTAAQLSSWSTLTVEQQRRLKFYKLKLAHCIVLCKVYKQTFHVYWIYFYSFLYSSSLSQKMIVNQLLSTLFIQNTKMGQ